MPRCDRFIGGYSEFLAYEGAFEGGELPHAIIQRLQYCVQSSLRAACVVQLLALLYSVWKENRSSIRSCNLIFGSYPRQ